MNKLTYALVFILNVCVLPQSFANYSDVVGVNPQHLTAEFWLAKSSANTILNRQKIADFNQQLTATNKHVLNPLSIADAHSRDQLKALVFSISSVPSYPRFYPDGKELGAQDYKTYLENLNLNGIKQSNKTQWALVTKRTSLRTFPTSDRVLNSGMDYDLDRFQETAVFPGESLAVLHQSADKAWHLVRSYNYLAWVKASDIALGSKQQIAQFNQQLTDNKPLVVTGAKVFTTFVPNQPEVSELQLDMGVKLPLHQFSDEKNTNQVPVGQVYGQNPYASHIVTLPVRNTDGSLEFKPALIAFNQDVNIGFLAFNENNIIAQAFKFLGERYGWGHGYNSRDCTGFIGEIYKSFGIYMPRNSSQQGKGRYGQNIDFDADASKEQKLAAIAKLSIGDLIYIPGHVMMYLGTDQGQPYIIHDVKGLGYLKSQGELYRGTLNGVSVTPLLDLQLSESKSYLDKIYNIKGIR